MGPCLFAAFMGLTRLLFGKYGGKADLQRFMAWSGVLCVISYLLAALSPVPVLSLIGCGLCGLSVGILWPGTFSMAARHCPGGGTALFGLLALAGDVGCAAGPGMVGAVSNAAGHWNSGFLAWLSRQGANGGLKAGLLTAVIFPAGLLILLVILRRAAGKTQKKKEESAFS